MLKILYICSVLSNPLATDPTPESPRSIELTDNLYPILIAAALVLSHAYITYRQAHQE